MKFIHPSLPLSHELSPYLTRIDNTAIYTNNGPLVQEFEKRLAWRSDDNYFVATNNCTTALMVALAQAKTPRRPWAIMPSFTFAATAQAAVWAGFEPYFVDIDTDLFLNEAAVGDALDKVGGQAVVVPCATFGEPFRLDFYNELVYAGVPVVVDAAAAFDAKWLDKPWGQGFRGTMCYSFHATKPYGIGEGGALRTPYPELADIYRAMIGFGFEPGYRNALHLGLNGKMSEYHAAVALAVDAGWTNRRARLMRLKERYATGFGDIMADSAPAFYAHVYETAHAREAAKLRLTRQRIGYGRYFSPACHQQSEFFDCRRDTMQVTEDVAERILCLPLHSRMTVDDVDAVLVETIER